MEAGERAQLGAPVEAERHQRRRDEDGQLRDAGGEQQAGENVVRHWTPKRCLDRWVSHHRPEPLVVPINPRPLRSAPRFGVQCLDVQTVPDLPPHLPQPLHGDRGRHRAAALVRRARAVGGVADAGGHAVANDRPGIALIGCGGMGRGDIKSASRFGDVVARLRRRREPRRRGRRSSSRTATRPPEQFTDFRKVLERKDVNVIVNATPDHWHTLINLAAAGAEEGHLRREAADADHRRRQAAGEGGAQGEASCCRPARSSAATSCSGWRASWCATAASAS